ncbi:hypothetical protein [Streptomyces mirabilis]|uniref:hypothetical protein n=1 Tax=Streptomyces mirabilis TaxID=68239 RepID=UPI0036CF24CD
MTAIEDVEEKVRAYAAAYLEAYGSALDKNFPGLRGELNGLGLASSFFPLYGRQVGRDVALAVMTTPWDFYLFFLDEPESALRQWREGELAHFNRNWTFDKLDESRQEEVQNYLGLTASEVIGVVNVPGTDFISTAAADMPFHARQHGVGHANRDAVAAKAQLPALRASADRQDALSGLSSRYRELLTWSGTPQKRGQKFEVLWRDALAFHGWHPRKIRLSGEDNDFTAIHEGVHVLGEVRWFAVPMAGGKMREFLSKLDPRPQTVGLFVSWSGFDEGAISVARRVVATKTVVLFEKSDIEKVLLGHIDPGDLFNEKLRAVYDLLFEM